jgi:hypothetical protein
MKYSGFRILLCSAFFLASTAAPAAVYSQKTVILLQAAPSNAPCIYFQLAGVATADSSVSSSPYFAMHKDHPGYAQAYAMLLAAKMTDMPVHVSTTGTIANAVCGNYAGVNEILLE